MTRPTKLPCGCTHDADRWLSECSTHKAEEDAKHARALAEHRGQRAPATVVADATACVLPGQYAPAADWLDIPNP